MSVPLRVRQVQRRRCQGQRKRSIHAAQIATYTTFQWRGAIRELGKAVGLPPEEIDALSEGASNYYRDRGRPSGAKAAIWTRWRKR
jgi:hypothetical protein